MDEICRLFVAVNQTWETYKNDARLARVQNRIRPGKNSEQHSLPQTPEQPQTKYSIGSLDYAMKHPALTLHHKPNEFVWRTVQRMAYYALDLYQFYCRNGRMPGPREFNTPLLPAELKLAVEKALQEGDYRKHLGACEAHLGDPNRKELLMNTIWKCFFYYPYRFNLEDFIVCMARNFVVAANLHEREFEEAVRIAIIGQMILLVRYHETVSNNLVNLIVHFNQWDPPQLPPANS